MPQPFPLSHRYDLALSSPLSSPLSPEPNSALNIALFGTSADPPTVGHEFILRWLGKSYDHVAVWAADNPFKAHQASLPQRLEMLALVIAPLQPQVQLYPDLSHLRTFHTLEAAVQRWPQAEFTLVVGSDLVPQLPSWFEIKRLLQMTRLLVIPRPDSALRPADLERCQALGAQISVADLVGLPVSSTAYRHERSPQTLPVGVQDYIQHWQLYGNSLHFTPATPYPLRLESDLRSEHLLHPSQSPTAFAAHE
jgi:nicotinate-nucleotide adenylyltransferase